MSLKYESERLRFAMMTDQDGELMLDLDSDPKVMRYITHGKTTSAREMQYLHIPRMISYTDSIKGWGRWKTFRKEDGQFIGWFLLRPYQGNPAEIEIGWRFKQKYWGMGYGTEGARIFRDHAFRQNDVLKIIAIAMSGNKGSCRIMEKIGMGYIKTIIYKDPLLPDEEVVLYEMEKPANE